MIIIKPKMLEGKFKIDNGENALYSAGLISGALGSRIELKISANYRLSDEQKYLTKIIKESGCVVKKSKNMYLPLCSGMMNSVEADAENLGENIFFAVVFLCFLKGISSIGPDKALLVGTLEPVSATIISFFWLHTSFTAADIIGFLCILGTVVILTCFEKKESKRIPTSNPSCD